MNSKNFNNMFINIKKAKLITEDQNSNTITILDESNNVNQINLHTTEDTSEVLFLKDSDSKKTIKLFSGGLSDSVEFYNSLKKDLISKNNYRHKRKKLLILGSSLTALLIFAHIVSEKHFRYMWQMPLEHQMRMEIHNQKMNSLSQTNYYEKNSSGNMNNQHMNNQHMNNQHMNNQHMNNQNNGCNQYESKNEPNSCNMQTKKNKTNNNGMDRVDNNKSEQNLNTDNLTPPKNENWEPNSNLEDLSENNYLLDNNNSNVEHYSLKLDSLPNIDEKQNYEQESIVNESMKIDALEKATESLKDPNIKLSEEELNLLPSNLKTSYLNLIENQSNTRQNPISFDKIKTIFNKIQNESSSDYGIPSIPSMESGLSTISPDEIPLPGGGDVKKSGELLDFGLTFKN